MITVVLMKWLILRVVEICMKGICWSTVQLLRRVFFRARYGCVNPIGDSPQEASLLALLQPYPEFVRQKLGGRKMR